MRKIRIFSLAVAGVLCLAVAAWAGVPEMADLLMKADGEKKPIPVVSQTEPNLDVKTAYGVQKVYVQKRLAKDKVGGFKAGLTTAGGQKAFGVTAPLTGVLYQSGKLEGSPVVERKDFRFLGMETEIGYVIGKAINRPVRDVQELQGMIKAVMPAIELPDLGFAAEMKAVKGVDLIAANVGSAKFIAGTPRPHKGVDLNQVNVTLLHNGQEINKGKGMEALGDQWKAALWMVNTLVEQGYKMEPGNILITGALGKLIPGKPGQYVADYGDFGKISFEVK